MEEYEIFKMLKRTEKDIIGVEGLKKIKIYECGEELVPINSYVPTAIIAPRESRVRFEGEQLWAREAVARKLGNVADRIAPKLLKIYDAFRPIEYQQERYDLALNEIAGSNPSWTEEQVKAQAFIRSFPPSLDPQQPPAHTTGGAIDLTLTNENGEELDMGSAWGDFESPFMYTNATKGLSPRQIVNRIDLVRVMGLNDFMSFPGEWWHFSYGDREWSAYKGLEFAIYGRAEDPYKKRRER